MRAFVGIPLPPLPALASLLDELAATDADLKVVPAKNLHVTLKFLGDIDEKRGPEIVQRLQSAGFPTGFPLGLRGVGAFPDWKKLNIVWVGLDDPQGQVARSFALSEQVFAQLGFPVETRPFSPHVTIARKRSDRGKDQAKQVLNRHRDAVFGEFTATGPCLYKSTLTPDGPVYESLGGVA